MITDLTSRKLISVKKQDNREFFSVHRLLQHRLLQDLEENVQERDAIFNLAFELIRERLPRPSLDSPDSVKWTVFKEYIPHVLTMQRIYDDGMTMIQPFVRLSELFRDGGIHLWQRGLIYDGLRLLNSAEAILDRIGECNCEACRNCNKDQLRIDINIGTALLIQYFGISHRAESKLRFGKILEIRRKLSAAAAMTKDDDITLCNASADYANALLQFNNYEEAEPIYQECHEKYQQWGTEDDIDLSFEYAKFNHHMGLCRMYKKDFAEARALSEKAVELVSRQTSQLQLTLRFKFDLGCIVLQSGDAEKALEIQEQILNTRLHMQGNGKANYFTLQSYYAVGAIYAHLGRLEQAEYVRLERPFPINLTWLTSH
jgi:tetratricopeptide (TPR) repeat protein